MPNYIGIDLGTTYSAVASIDDSGRPRIIENNGKNITASCVALENDELIVGDIPESRYGHKGFDVGARFKRFMGKEHNTKLGSREFKPVDLSAAVLSEMKRLASSQLGEIAEAVITIPANFMQEARDATMAAARKAGLNVKYIINEPTAAALYYSYTEERGLNGNYVVYDLGGGTFDVSLVSVAGDNVEVIATEGVAELGGDDFDKALRKIIISKFQETAGQDASEDSIPLSDMAKLKIKLSERDKSPYMFEGEIIEVTRNEFEAAIKPLVNQTELLCETLLDDAKLAPSDIQEVFLAGGSTRVPAIRRSIEKIFQRSPTSTANVDEVVALGAALYAAMKSDGAHLSPTQAASVSVMKVSEIATYYFGTFSVGYNESRKTQELMNTIIISKGEKIPCSRTEEFSTIQDNQTAIHCTVTKSGSPETDRRFVTVVWEGDMELPEGRPKGQPVQVTYAFDENGMMNCTFLDVESGRKSEIQLDSLSKDPGTSEIDKFLVD